MASTLNSRRFTRDSLTETPNQFLDGINVIHHLFANAFSIFVTVASSGITLAFSILLSVSGRMPARRASSAWDSPAALRLMTMSRQSKREAFPAPDSCRWAAA